MLQASRSGHQGSAAGVWGAIRRSSASIDAVKSELLGADGCMMCFFFSFFSSDWFLGMKERDTARREEDMSLVAPTVVLYQVLLINHIVLNQRFLTDKPYRPASPLTL